MQIRATYLSSYKGKIFYGHQPIVVGSTLCSCIMKPKSNHKLNCILGIGASIYLGYADGGVCRRIYGFNGPGNKIY